MATEETAWLYDVAQIVTAFGVIITAISSIYNRYEIRKASRKVEKKVDTVVVAANGLAESALEAKFAAVRAQNAVVDARAAVADVKAAVVEVKAAVANGNKVT
jgi:hypothetical protein